MESWDDARVLLAVLRHGSFTAAARALGFNQSTVSRRVAALEHGLGRPLFRRVNRTLEPTELATRLREHAERIEQAFVALEHAASQDEEPAGRVSLATAEELSSALLVPAFARLHARHPDLALEIVAEGRVADLDRGEADLALRVVRPTRGDLVSRAVATLSYHAYASKGYRTRAGERPMAELTWVALCDPHGVLPEARWVEALLDGRAPALRTNDTLDLALAASKGIGAALLPEALAGRHRNLVRLSPGSRPVLTRKLWLVTHRGLVDVPRVRAVMDWIIEACAEAS